MYLIGPQVPLGLRTTVLVNTLAAQCTVFISKDAV